MLVVHVDYAFSERLTPQQADEKCEGLPVTEETGGIIGSCQELYKIKPNTAWAFSSEVNIPFFPTYLVSY